MIPTKEDEYTEFKKGNGQIGQGLLSLSAMLNKHGRGTLYIGIDDDGNVVGTDIGKDTIDNIKNDIRSDIRPKIISDVVVIRTNDGKEILSVSVKGSDIPYSHKGRYYVRDGTADVEATPLMLRRLLMAGKDDLLVGRKSHIQGLTFSSFDYRLQSMDIHTDFAKNFHEGLGMKDDDGDYNMVAYLVSDQNDFSMQVVRFEGKDRSEMSSRKDFGHKFIFTGIQSMIDHLDSLNITRVSLSSGRRTETNLFDMDSVREAIINAYVHNNWLGMLPPSVFVFDDRIEIQSYGSIPVNLSLEEFYNGRSVPVNKALFDIFRTAGLAEQSGHGVPAIVKVYGRNCFHIGTDTVTVTIPFAFEPDWAIARRTKNITVDLTENEKKVIRCAKKNSHASNADIASAVGVSTATVNRIVSTLKGYGILTNEGNNRINTWVVTEP